jgi:PAS domain S-box-containing protein
MKMQAVAETRGSIAAGPGQASNEHGFCLFDAELRLTTCNPAFVALLGYPKRLTKPGTRLSELIRHDAKRGLIGAEEVARLLTACSRDPDTPVLRTEVRTGKNGEPVELTVHGLAGGGVLQIATPQPTSEIDVVVGVWAELQRYRDYAEASSDWFWETDAELRFTHLTESFMQQLGPSEAAVIGVGIAELVDQGRLSSKEHTVCMAAMHAREAFRAVRYTVHQADGGAPMHMRLSGQPLFDHRNQFLGYRGSGTDVTAELGALRRAEKTRQQMDAAIDAFSEGIALFDAEDRLIFCNQRYREFYAAVADRLVPGTAFEDLVRCKAEAGLFADRGAELDELLARYVGLHRNPGDSLEVRLSDGRWLRVTDRRTPDGGIVSVRTEITELKRREVSLTRLSAEVRTQMLRFDTALNNMIQGLCMFDARQRLIVCNERYLELYRFSPDVVKPGVTLREIMEYSVSLGNYTAEDAERAIAERPTHATRRQTAVLLQRLRDGRVIAVMHQPMTDGGSVATYEEVTERIRAEDALRAHAEKLEHSNRELQDFASIASHDLQEPLRKIEAFGDRLSSRCGEQLGDNGRMYVERMQSAAGRMRVLINDLLSYSRVTSRAKPFATIDMHEVATEVLEDLQITLERAKGKVDLGPLPTIDADATQIRQLIQNLISNALKFCAEGVDPVVTVSAEVLEPPAPDTDFDPSPSGLIELRIADNGIGFDMKYADRIFGIFQRLHGRNEYEGTGIGLATCRKICERHSGAIRAESAPGEGAAFFMRLPIRHPSSDADLTTE